jgi:lipid-binding SYLF domain-containing protein
MMLTASTCVLALSGSYALAAPPEAVTVDTATEVLQAFSGLKVHAIPPALLQDAQGVAIIPNVIKAGFVLGGRFGRGVVLVRQRDGSWGHPIFITLGGGGIGWQAGVQSTDLVLVFKTRNGLERILMGRSKLTLGADLAVAAGPVGRQASAATDGQLRAEIYSYSRSRGLFAGLSVEGAGIGVDSDANESYYRLPGGRPTDIMNLGGRPVPAASEGLRILLTRLTQAPPSPQGDDAQIAPLPLPAMPPQGVPPAPYPR